MQNTDRVGQVPLDQIGQKLKAAREGQGLTLNQINERTKIPINHLQAIDSGQTDDLPEPVYVAGFIKRYADCVGLNGQALSDEYRQSSDNGQKNGDSGWALRMPAAQPVMVSSNYMKRARITDKPPSILKTIFYPTILLLGCLWLVIALYQWQERNNASQVDPSVLTLGSSSRFNQVQPTAAPNSPTQSGPTQAGPNTTQPAVQTPSESKISLTASKHVWVEVKSISTGNSLFTGFLEAGDRRDYSDPQGLRVHAGNGASVNVESDGKSQVLGLPGKITEKVFMAKNPAGGDATATAAGTAPTGTSSSGTATTAAAVKPPVKKVVKRTATSDGSSAPRKRPRAFDEGSGRGYLPGENLGGTRSIDVPYRYNDGRLDSD